MDSLINNPPFIDGNKRVGVAATGLFIQRNGYRLTATNSELEAFTRQVASSPVDIADIAGLALNP